MAASTIALLDNDPAFLALLHDLLAGEGYRILRWCPAVGEDAPLRAAQPDLVILALGLGGARRGGWEFVQRLRGDFATTDMPLIVLTGAAETPPVGAEISRAIRCRFARRPFAHGDLRDLGDLGDLLAQIEAVLGPSPVKRARGDRTYAGTAEEATGD